MCMPPVLVAMTCHEGGTRKKKKKKRWCRWIKYMCVRQLRTPTLYDVTHTSRVRGRYRRFVRPPSKFSPCVMYSHWSHCFIILKVKQWAKSIA